MANMEKKGERKVCNTKVTHGRFYSASLLVEDKKHYVALLCHVQKVLQAAQNWEFLINFYRFFEQQVIPLMMLDLNKCVGLITDSRTFFGPVTTV